jgi:hypothetical protein
MNDVFKEFLVKYAGFGDPPLDQELDEILPKWKMAAKKLGLTEEDHEYAMKVWIPRNYDINSEGVRKVIGAYVAEVTDMMMAEEYKKQGHKLVYGIPPAISPYYRAIKFTNPEVHTYFPDATLTFVLFPFFRKKVYTFLEEAEAHGMRYGCRHCALNKVRYAALRRGVIPMPDVSWIWGFVCDQGPKSDEFIKEMWDERYPTVYSRLPHDQEAFKVEHKDEERVKYLGSVMREGFEKVCEKVGVEVDERSIKDALNERLSYLTKFAELSVLEASNPPPLDPKIVTVDVAQPMFSAYNTGYKYWLIAIEALIKEGREKVARGEGVAPLNSPKVLASFTANPVPPRLFLENKVVPFGPAFLPTKADLQPPKFSDPFEACAETWLKWAPVVNWGRTADITIEQVKTYNLDAVIWGFIDFDRWIGSPNKICARYVEEKTGVPNFYIEGDIWEDRDYGEEVLRTRIETICEIIKMRKLAKS